jgi:hypothetical protein
MTEDGENTLPIDSVDFMGRGGEHFDDLLITSHSSDESVLCNVSTVGNDSIRDLDPDDTAHNLDTDDDREDVGKNGVRLEKNFLLAKFLVVNTCF